MWLVATDEAGYGPKLGPLVVVATTWWIDTDGDAGEQDASLSEQLSMEALEGRDVFQPFRERLNFHGIPIRVDDSKAIFKPRSAAGRGNDGSEVMQGVPPNLRTLHAITSAASCLSLGTHSPWGRWLSEVAPDDVSSLLDTPWLGMDDLDLETESVVRPILEVWRTAAASLHRVNARVINAAQFNAYCDDGKNKSDLLSNATLGLVRDSVRRIRSGGHRGRVSDCDETPVAVFCDRHGGRRYYAPVLQDAFRDSEDAPLSLRVVDEERHCSRYRMDWSDRKALFQFTVKGDRFTPVAMSSLIAKYIRERMMRTLNQYFGTNHRGDQPIMPTAGYPVDADRYLADIAPIIDRLGIDRSRLVRCR